MVLYKNNWIVLGNVLRIVFVIKNKYYMPYLVSQLKHFK